MELLTESIIKTENIISRFLNTIYFLFYRLNVQYANL